MTIARRLGSVALTASFLLAVAGPATAALAAPTPSPTPTPSPSPTRTSSPTPSPSPTHSRTPPPHHRPKGTTVTGPRMWDPAHNRRFSRPSTVTVSQTANLVNEMVHVSWTHFTPSSQVLYDQTVTDYPVMVAECNTPRPRFWSQCYGANNGGVQGAFGPFGPMNTAYATTAPGGAGQLDIQILTLADNANQFLGCSVHHKCSLVIVPSQGGNTLASPANCADHSLDTGGTDLGQFAFSNQTGGCSWKQRIVVPLTFAPSPANCPIKTASFAAIGSPMLARAMDQWRAGLCSGGSPLAFTFNAAITEPEAIQDLPLGLGDIALTTRPGPQVTIGKKTYAYAPLTISAVAIAYWIDNPATGAPVRHLRLNARLVAKLITLSYNFENEGCGKGTHRKAIGCDGAVDGNPFSLFADREFRRLNPKIQPPNGNGAAFQVPTVESGHSDMTWELTRWLSANKAASSFLAGQFDPWGMHVNTDYLGLHWPNDSFTGQDSYPVIAHKYSPVFPLNAVAQYQAQNWDPGTDWEKDQFGNFPRDPIEIPGERALFAVLDESDAAAFRFPVAQLRNAKGKFVAPSARSMAAALPSMITSTNHVTQRADFARQSAGAYPLTMVIYAQVPVSGVSPAKAAAIARFLDYVAGPGQLPGLRPGRLAPGYLPLTARLRAQTRKVAAEVLAQHGAGSASPTPTPTPTGAGTSVPPSGSASPTPSPGIVTIALRAAERNSAVRYLLPIVLILGAAATVIGSSSLLTRPVSGDGGGGPGGIRGLALRPTLAGLRRRIAWLRPTRRNDS